MSDAINEFQNRYGSGGTGTTQAPGRIPNQAAFNVDDALAGVTILWDKSIPNPATAATQFSDRTGRSNTVYQSMDVSRSFAESLGAFYQFGPQQLALVQAQLVNSGFLTDSKWTSFGEQDEKSYDAWKKALTRAARSGQSIWNVLGAKSQQDLSDNAQAYFNRAVATVGSRVRASSGSGGAGRAPLQIRYSNPDDLRAVASATATEVLGSVPDGAFVDSFVKTYQAVEGQAQRSAYAGGNFTQPPDAGVIAAKEARTRYATQATGQSMAKVFEQFLSIIGGSNAR